MKSKKFYLVCIIVLLLNEIFFSIATPQFIDNTLETKIEVSLEEKKSSDKLIIAASMYDLKSEKEYTRFYFLIPRVSVLYLNNIFKPPIFLYA
jgi:hypothetical protein